MNLHKSHRHTIMDGRVVTFAPLFIEVEAVFGKSFKPFGEFEISVSRDCVRVLKCVIRFDQPDHLEGFNKAMKLAWKEHEKLNECNGRPEDGWDGTPVKLEL